MNIENKILDKLMEFNSCDNVVYKCFYENIAKEISIEIKLLTAKLEAKVCAYEKIIANSNFKAILEEKESKGEDNEN